jgi:hypothetical protein
MTLLEVCYRYTGTLTPAQMRKLGELGGVYGLRRIRVEEERHEIRIEFDASRLKESEALHIVRQAGIPLTEKITTLVSS